MTVDDLKEILEGFGGHLEVICENVETGKVYDFSVEGYSREGEPCIVIDVLTEE